MDRARERERVSCSVKSPADRQTDREVVLAGAETSVMGLSAPTRKKKKKTPHVEPSKGGIHTSASLLMVKLGFSLRRTTWCAIPAFGII